MKFWSDDGDNDVDNQTDEGDTETGAGDVAHDLTELWINFYRFKCWLTDHRCAPFIHPELIFVESFVVFRDKDGVVLLQLEISR